MKKTKIFFYCFIYGLILILRIGLGNKFFNILHINLNYEKLIKNEIRIYCDQFVICLGLSVIYYFIYPKLITLQVKLYSIVVLLLLSYLLAVIIFSFRMYKDLIIYNCNKD